MADFKENFGFPDRDYLRSLARHMRGQAEAALEENPLEAIQVEAGRRLNWIAYYLTDKAISWEKDEQFLINKLTLTGTCPSWNTIILDQCHGSPQEFRELLRTDPTMVPVFASIKSAKVAILVRFEENKHYVLDGMNRTIAAIRDGETTVSAFIATPQGLPQPQCEPHVVYDLLVSYQRKMNTDRKGLIAALRFLLKSYSNVEDLLRDRFNSSRLRNTELQAIIQEVLNKITKSKRPQK